MSEAKRLHGEASRLMEDGGELQEICPLVNKGLLYAPNFHPLHALKGDIYLRQGLRTVTYFELLWVYISI